MKFIICNLKPGFTLKTHSKISIQLSVSCPSDGFYADPCNCDKFYQCYAGTAYHKGCQSGLLWNDEYKVLYQKK